MNGYVFYFPITGKYVDIENGLLLCEIDGSKLLSHESDIRSALREIQQHFNFLLDFELGQRYGQINIRDKTLMSIQWDVETVTYPMTKVRGFLFRPSPPTICRSYTMSTGV